MAVLLSRLNQTRSCLGVNGSTVWPKMVVRVAIPRKAWGKHTSCACNLFLFVMIIYSNAFNFYCSYSHCYLVYSHQLQPRVSQILLFDPTLVQTWLPLVMSHRMLYDFVAIKKKGGLLKECILYKTRLCLVDTSV